MDRPGLVQNIRANEFAQGLYLLHRAEEYLALYDAEGGDSVFDSTVLDMAYGNNKPTAAEFHDGVAALKEVVAYIKDPVRYAKIARIRQ
jgi:hypothetical protein